MLIFRNENDTVARKVRDTEASELSANTTAHRTAVSRTGAACPNRQDAFLMPNLICPLEEQASSFFFNKFVNVDSISHSGYLDFLPAMYDHSKSNDALTAVITAVGIACLSNILVAPEMMDAARNKYALALRLINAALQDPSKAITDQTCTAVILFGLYEVITNVRIDISPY
jgi:hypothetical protein